MVGVIAEDARTQAEAPEEDRAFDEAYAEEARVRLEREERKRRRGV